jgi:ketosteroid isomerase-like protein
MAHEEANVGALKEAFRRWHETKAGGVQHWLDLMADDVCFRSLAGGAPGMDFTRDRHSRADVARYFEEMSAEWEMVHFTPDEFIAQGERVAVVGRCGWRSRKTGTVAESLMAHFFTFRDGRIVDVLEFFDTAKAVAAHTTGARA